RIHALLADWRRLLRKHAPQTRQIISKWLDGRVAWRLACRDALWCADYKGKFTLANRRHRYPLTITDFANRCLLTCERQRRRAKRMRFPYLSVSLRIRPTAGDSHTDNGVPFAALNALHGLSRLSVWWLRLSIQNERILPRASRAERSA